MLFHSLLLIFSDRHSSNRCSAHPFLFAKVRCFSSTKREYFWLRLQRWMTRSARSLGRVWWGYCVPLWGLLPRLIGVDLQFFIGTVLVVVVVVVCALLVFVRVCYESPPTPVHITQWTYAKQTTHKARVTMGWLAIVCHRKKAHYDRASRKRKEKKKTSLSFRLRSCIDRANLGTMARKVRTRMTNKIACVFMYVRASGLHFVSRALTSYHRK